MEWLLLTALVYIMGALCVGSAVRDYLREDHEEVDWFVYIMVAVCWPLILASDAWDKWKGRR